MPDTRSVLLRHDLPDGAWHYDWLVEPDGCGASGGAGGDSDRCLIAFRLDGPPERARGRFRAVRLPDHRRLYLDFEGELSDGRGSVRRISSYRCRLLNHKDDSLRLRLLSDAGTIILSGARAPEQCSDGELEVWHFDGYAEP